MAGGSMLTVSTRNLTRHSRLESQPGVSIKPAAFYSPTRAAQISFRSLADGFERFAIRIEQQVGAEARREIGGPYSPGTRLMLA
jgi:hypothetical protein